jgi:hypothetical protein
MSVTEERMRSLRIDEKSEGEMPPSSQSATEEVVVLLLLLSSDQMKGWRRRAGEDSELLGWCRFLKAIDGRWGLLVSLKDLTERDWLTKKERSVKLGKIEVGWDCLVLWEGRERVDTPLCCNKNKIVLWNDFGIISNCHMELARAKLTLEEGNWIHSDRRQISLQPMRRLEIKKLTMLRRALTRGGGGRQARGS